MSSTAIVSSQPMSLPGTFQLGLSLKANQRSSMTIPIPQEVLASTKMSREETGPGALTVREKEDSDKRRDHHLRSVRSVCEGKRLVKVLPWKVAAKLDRAGR